MQVKKTILALTLAMTSAVTFADTAIYAGYAGGNHSNYGYLGGVFGLSGQQLEKADGWLGRLWLSYLDFDYSLNPGDINGKGPGLEVAVGYQKYLSPTTRLTGYLGYVYRDIKLNPNDPASEVDDKDSGAKIQVELLARPHEKIDFWAGASYVSNIEDVWAKVRAGYLFNQTLSLGPEVEAISGRAYDKVRVGLSLEGLMLAPNASLGLRVGHENDQKDDRNGAYGGVALKVIF